MKIVLYLVGFVLLGLVAVLAVLGVIEMPSIPPSRSPPPADFSAADYPDINALAGTDRITVHDLNHYGAYFESYYLPDQKAAYFIFLNPDGKTIVCIGANGAIIGVIEGPSHLFPIGNIFVDIDGYHEVGADKVTPKAGYQLIGADLSVDALQRYHDESTLFWTFTAQEVGAGHPEYADGITTHVMLHNGVWKKAVTRSAQYLAAKTVPFHDLDRISSLSFQEPQTLMGAKYTLDRPYFDQQEYLSRKSAPIGSTTGVGRPAHWRGTGYYSLRAGGDAVRFSIPNDIMNQSGFGATKLYAYGHDDLDFVFINHSPIYYEHIVYLVTAAGG